VFSLTIDSTLASMIGWVYLLYDESEDVSSFGRYAPLFFSGNEDIFTTRCLLMEFKSRSTNGFGCCWSTGVLIDMMWATPSRSPTLQS
jgi:hypothetical protein